MIRGHVEEELGSLPLNAGILTIKGWGPGTKFRATRQFKRASKAPSDDASKEILSVQI